MSWVGTEFAWRVLGNLSFWARKISTRDRQRWRRTTRLSGLGSMHLGVKAGGNDASAFISAFNFFGGCRAFVCLAFVATVSVTHTSVTAHHFLVTRIAQAARTAPRLSWAVPLTFFAGARATTLTRGIPLVAFGLLRPRLMIQDPIGTVGVANVHLVVAMKTGAWCAWCGRQNARSLLALPQAVL